MKILIIEDDRSIQNFLKRGLRYKQAVVHQAFDGMEGLEKLENNKYDIAIVDLLLPKLDGSSLIQKARDNGIETPIIALSALQELSTKTHLLDIGVDDYMVKPFSFEELFARILAVTRRSQNKPPTQYIKLDDLTLIPEKRIAERSGKEIPLRKKEYLLLEYFMQHPNKVISREDLIQNVWGYQENMPSNTVDSHISSLRNKINKGYKNSLIDTVHGVGYMLSSNE
ncbi:response regulator transcription factor [Candidatus Pacearchaeota archaeon]|nr:response regulator transcription factor [Candidatus Pacearchaeota archaeon]